MAKVTRRRTGELLRRLIEILMNQPEGMRAKDALAALAASVQLTDHEAGNYLERLYDLWVEYYDKLAEKARRFLPLRPIYFLAPES